MNDASQQCGTCGDGYITVTGYVGRTFVLQQHNTQRDKMQYNSLCIDYAQPGQP